MSIKKTAIITVFMSAIFISANLMVAQAYEPLVRLPGLPAEGPLSLSQYIVGLYNFLLSIVGIVAVMMLIIGGMKYIAAAGNASVIADAKDTISNAIFGLLLALLSWVIVSTINPDVLYIKNPASSLTDAYESNLGACGTYVDPVCTCKDEATPAAIDQATCEAACADNCGTTESLSCIYGASSPDPSINKDGELSCRCVDGADVVSLAPVGTGCNEICQNPGFVTDGLRHCFVVDARIGYITEEITSPTKGDTATLINTSIEYPIYVSENSSTACQVFFTGKRYSVVEDISAPGIQCSFDHFPPFDVFDCIDVPGSGCACGEFFQLCSNLGTFWAIIEGNAANQVNCTKKTAGEHLGAWVCANRFSMTDNYGNTKEDVIYVGYEKP